MAAVKSREAWKFYAISRLPYFSHVLHRTENSASQTATARERGNKKYLEAERVSLKTSSFNGWPVAQWFIVSTIHISPPLSRATTTPRASLARIEKRASSSVRQRQLMNHFSPAYAEKNIKHTNLHAACSLNGSICIRLMTIKLILWLTNRRIRTHNSLFHSFIELTHSRRTWAQLWGLLKWLPRPVNNCNSNFRL